MTIRLWGIAIDDSGAGLEWCDAAVTQKSVLQSGLPPPLVESVARVVMKRRGD